MTSSRFDGAVARGREVQIIVEDRLLRAFAGETVAAAPPAAGRRAFRTTSRRCEPRGVYCGIGVCFDCVMTVDGRLKVRTCQTPVRAGMCVESRREEGTWTLEAEPTAKGGPTWDKEY